MLELATLLAFSVSGGSTCPTPDQIQQRVAPLLTDVAKSHRARVERAGDVVSIEVLDDVGRSIGRRELPAAAASCDELIGAVAVVIAALEAEGRASDAPALRLRPPQPAIVTPAPRRAGVAVALDLGAFAEAAGDVAPAGALAVHGGPPGRAWELEASLLAVGAHDRAIGPGTGRWRRASAGAGAGWVWTHGRWSARLGVEALLSWIRLDGRGFAEDERDAAVEPGIAASPRIAFGGAAWALWVGGLVMTHPLDRVMTIEGGNGGTTYLPKLEWGAGAGVRWIIAP